MYLKTHTVADKQKREESAYLVQLKKTFGWLQNPSHLLQAPYQSLVLTNASQLIVWVNREFYQMTGYEDSFAINRTPGFLQGEQTSSFVKAEIRKAVASGDCYSGSVINYRRNGEPYVCRINIYPLTNKAGQATHFLALEEEIK